MNAKQRRKAERLKKDLCDRCGKRGAHFVETSPPQRHGWFTQDIRGKGFYTCDDLYDESGRRKDMSGLPVTTLHPDMSLAIGLSLLEKARQGELL